MLLFLLLESRRHLLWILMFLITESIGLMLVWRYYWHVNSLNIKPQSSFFDLTKVSVTWSILQLLMLSLNSWKKRDQNEVVREDWWNAYFRIVPFCYISNVCFISYTLTAMKIKYDFTHLSYSPWRTFHTCSSWMCCEKINSCDRDLQKITFFRNLRLSTLYQVQN